MGTMKKIEEFDEIELKDGRHGTVILVHDSKNFEVELEHSASADISEAVIVVNINDIKTVK